MKNIRQFLFGMLFLLSAIPVITIAYTGQYSWDPIYISPTLQTQNSQLEQSLKSQYGVSAFYGCYSCTYTDTSDPNVEARCLNAAESCLEKKAASETPCFSGYYKNILGQCVSNDSLCKGYGEGAYSTDGKMCSCKSGYEWNSVGTACEKIATTVITFNPPAATDANSANIPEGAMIKNADNPDVYIVKYKNNKKFKRLILSPSVFKSYGHLKWEDIKTVSRDTLSSFTTSDIVRAVGDWKIYRLSSSGDVGEKRHIKNADVFEKFGLDNDAIYEINEFDRDTYTTGAIVE